MRLPWTKGEILMSNRLVLGLFGLALVSLGCSTSSGRENENKPDGPSGQLEVFSWWTAGGEQQGFLALVEVFNAQYPNVEVFNSTVQGGSGTDARATLAKRLEEDEPPGTFQVHAGLELQPLVTKGKMLPLTSLFEDEGWTKVMPSNLIDILSYDGEIWSVPVNIHRANVLWYNKSILADQALKPPTTWDEFFTVAETLKTAGIARSRSVERAGPKCTCSKPCSSERSERMATGGSGQARRRGMVQR